MKKFIYSFMKWIKKFEAKNTKVNSTQHATVVEVYKR